MSITEIVTQKHFNFTTCSQEAKIWTKIIHSIQWFYLFCKFFWSFNQWNRCSSQWENFYVCRCRCMIIYFYAIQFECKTMLSYIHFFSRKKKHFLKHSITSDYELSMSTVSSNTDHGCNNNSFIIFFIDVGCRFICICMNFLLFLWSMTSSVSCLIEKVLWICITIAEHSNYGIQKDYQEKETEKIKNSVMSCAQKFKIQFNQDSYYIDYDNIYLMPTCDWILMNKWDNREKKWDKQR